MRFMLLMIPGGYETAPADAKPRAEQIAAMAAYNAQLKKAGVLLSLAGLHPPSTGVRVSFAGGEPQVRQGPFAEACEALGGFWMINVASQDEAIAWAKRCPAAPNEVIEIRRVQVDEDAPGDVPASVTGFANDMEPPPAH